MRFVAVVALVLMVIATLSVGIAQVAEVPVPTAEQVQDNGPLDDILHAFHVSDAMVQWITLILGGLFALEQYLASTKRFSANSTSQAIGNILKFLLGKK